MFVMDMPDVPPQYAPVVIAQAPQAQPPALQGSAKVDRTIGVCHLIQNPPIPPLTAVNAMSPVTAVWGYLQTQEQFTSKQLTPGMFNTAKASVLQGPEHGTLKGEWGQNYRYHPTPDYSGQDRATLLVEMGGLKVKVMYFFKVGRSAWGGTEGYDPYQDKKLCPKGPMWKISLNPADPNDQLLTFNSSVGWAERCL